MTDKELLQLYKSAYAAKNAGALEDFLNWLRQLFGGKRRNTFGENVGATLAGVGTAGAAGYGLYKGYKKMPKLEEYIKNNAPLDNALFRDIDKGGKWAGGKLYHRAPLNAIETLRKMPKAGKWGLLAGAGTAAGLAGGAIYDSLFNR